MVRVSSIIIVLFSTFAMMGNTSADAAPATRRMDADLCAGLSAEWGSEAMQWCRMLR